VTITSGTGISLLIVAIVGVAGGCGRESNASQPVRGASRPHIVAWVNHPATPPRAPAEPKGPRPRFIPCTGSELRAQQKGGGAGLGSVSTPVELTNISRSPCTLTGYPTFVTGLKADGSAHSLHVSHGTMFDEQAAWTANLQPDNSAEVVIATGDNCDALNPPHPHSKPYAGVVIGLPGGGSVHTRASFDAACGVGISRLGVRSHLARNPHAYRGLQLHVKRPGTAVAGSTLHFTVTLRNVSAHVVNLSPCPIYQEGLFIKRSHEATYRLNCASVTSIAPGTSVSYAMQQRVPAHTGSAKLSWGIPAATLFYGGQLVIRG
jgi:Protein of unknown function (DUF4232)